MMLYQHKHPSSWMMMMVLMVTSLTGLQAQAQANNATCFDQAPFTCPEGEFCTRWSDGCNDCGCDGPDALMAICTMKFCDCYNNNSCVPVCYDNDACVPVTEEAETEEPVPEDSTTTNNNAGAEAAPFDCPEGTYCTQWNDGCNECSAAAGSEMAMCTAMYCPCYDDNSCVPTCKDNPQCVPKVNNNEDATAGNDNNNNEDISTDTSLFDCPNDSVCLQWSDGCNQCTGSSENPGVGACTEKYCPCYDDNSCVPECLDNTECVPKLIQPENGDDINNVVNNNSNNSEPPDTSSPIPFDCPEGTTCTDFSDGCNQCTASADDTTGFSVGCTDMYCDCYADDSCVPVCHDNPDCVPKTGTPENDTNEDNNNGTDTTGEEEEDPAAPFNCPDGTFCTTWFDGCNECTSEPGSPFAGCTMKFCPCYEDNTCVPVCRDNPDCVPKSTTDTATDTATTNDNGNNSEQTTSSSNNNNSEEEDPAAPFDCPDGTFCTTWSDGCNECKADAESPFAGCTYKYCPCYEDNSCVPVCHDNPDCVPKPPADTTPSATATASSYSEGNNNDVDAIDTVVDNLSSTSDASSNRMPRWMLPKLVMATVLVIGTSML